LYHYFRHFGRIFAIFLQKTYFIRQKRPQKVTKRLIFLKKLLFDLLGRI